jgi:Na+-translocating ferredoxin:NAD+ oxidoreductase RNF subunit RnfB
MNSILIAAISMGGIGFAFAVLLTIANKKLKVEEDPKIAKVDEALPGANCGACGYPGCAACAEALVKGEVEISVCPVCDDAERQEIADILGVELSQGVRDVAVLFCQGGNENAKIKADYEGISSCLAATFVNGGERACEYGCIGKGDCIEVCDFDAIHMGENGLPIIDRQKCTACGKCVEACPRDIIELHPVNRHVFVLCKNTDKGAAARKVCDRACIACKICEKFDKSGGFQVEDFLARVDYDKYDKDYEKPTDKCPTNVIQIVGEKDEE